MISTLNPVTAGGGLGFAEFAELAAKNGFRGIDFSIEAAQALGLEEAREVLAKHNVAASAFGIPVEWRKDEQTFQTELEGLAEKARFARELGCSRTITWVLPSNDDVVTYRETSLRRWAEIARVLGDEGIGFGLEFLGPKQFRPDDSKVWFYDVLGALEAVDEVNARAGTHNVGLLVDCWHWFAGGGTLMDVASIPPEQVTHVHINDAPLGVALADLVDNERELPGTTGVIDLTGFLETLNRIGYEGPIAVETFWKRPQEAGSEVAAQEAAAAVKKSFEAAGLEF
ncbi:sugar phosphate isomerase/epimerase [bacterium]|nr:MAG: sugar phosphate isomerase/epimerase [bacterium]